MGTSALHPTNGEGMEPTFGLWLRHQREAHDFTRERLAVLIGCSTDTLKKLETHKRRPSRDLLTRLFRFLDVSATDQAALTNLARQRPPDAAPIALASPLESPFPPLPVPTTTLIGRTHERAAIGTLLCSSQARLIVLTGSPGVGKTRLALQVGDGRACPFRGWRCLSSAGASDDGDSGHRRDRPAMWCAR